MNAKIKRETLLDVIRKNRENHKSIVMEALEGYRKDVIAELERELEAAKAGKRLRRFMQFDQPVDQTREYDRAIRSLEMDIRDEIELTEQEFACYVMDQWQWRQAFVVGNAKYSATAMRTASTEGYDID